MELREKLLDWMHGTGAEPSFDEMALKVFRHQFELNAPYRRYSSALGRTPETLTGWQEIPAVPTDAFKLTRHPLRCFPAGAVQAVFRTSGTTRDIRGEHAFEDLTLYETSIIRGWERIGLPVPVNPWFLSQSPADAPDSSLVHMFGTLQQAHAPLARDRWLIDSTGRIDPAPLAEAVAKGEPITLFSTALGLLRMIESRQAVPLPPGSWIFETGGYKGVKVELEPAAFRALVAERFAIKPSKLLNEYGMTELSSPFYAWNGETAHRGSPWTRIRVIDPETGRIASPGEPGYLEVVDLANLGSVAAIRTQDLAIATGENSFTLLGRDPAALPRGCSRRADDLLNPS
ncbi:hypothetical protein KBB96_04595 [Luteolibacter ambystomatis]|uniref:Acyl-protein synthetase LuxE domain-containing protein n=1 Tax=Luteolibacter ambystomatis TaxID=2824561 RepID=A0A975J194_9BACT|nr:hypothetical protein [Luteolibacter ambystomatis]QUE52173.1 hypothetical protein KBB96_04595 [Luteolibacter ambystomatis]